MIRNANPNTLWELINGPVRNESIKYGSVKKKEKDKLEKRLTAKTENLNRNMIYLIKNNTVELLKRQTDKKSALNSIID